MAKKKRKLSGFNRCVRTCAKKKSGSQRTKFGACARACAGKGKRRKSRRKAR